MKNSNFLLFLLFIICTLNAWSQSEDQEFPSSNSEMATNRSLSVCINTQQVDGSVRITYENGTRGYTISKDQTYYYFDEQLYPSPGSTITVEAYILGLGYVNAVVLNVPEFGLYSTLYVDVTWNSMHQLYASIE